MLRELVILNSKLTMACSAAVLALAMAACSSSDDPPMAMDDPAPMPMPMPPTPLAVDLAAVTVGYVIAAGVVEVASGGTVNHGDVSFTCSGDEACTVSVADDGTVTSTGGSVTAANSPVYVANLEVKRLADAQALELKTAQTDAMKAAIIARTAANDADTAATAAKDAADGRAVIQTSDLPTAEDNSLDLAVLARNHADDAGTAADDAEAASTMAAEATTVSDAVAARILAMDAHDAAVKAQGLAEGQRDLALAAVDTELFVDGKTKTVGNISITIDDVEKSSTISGQTTVTGLMPLMGLSTPGARDANGRPVMFDQNVDGTATLVANRTATSNDIGFTYDSEKDDARVTLVHSYLGSQKEQQFLRNGDEDPFDGLHGAGDLDAPTNGDSIPVVEGKITVDHDNDGGTTPMVTVAPKSAGGHFVAADDPKKASVDLYYVETGVEETDDTKNDGIDQTKLFLERNVATSDGVSTTTYKRVAVIEVSVDDATEFEHLHYGIWNGLDAAAKNGFNDIADLGIGFVTILPDGKGMTNPDHDADGGMPNFGGATYDGNWVANIQEADKEGNGAIRRHSGEASVTADFVKDENGVVLSGLATLEGDIAGNRFEGSDKPKLNATLPGGLANADDFMGGFSGGFFGPSAAEAGGVFDYTSKDNKNGAFLGSFAGAR